MEPHRFRQYQPRRLEILDSTLREGQQTSLLHDHYKYAFTLEDKVELLRALIIYGVKFVELFAPVVSPAEHEAVAALRETRDGLITQKGYTFLLAHARCHPGDIEAAVQAGFDGLNLYFGTSPESRAHNHGKSLDEIIRVAVDLLEELRRNYPGLALRFSGEDAFRTPEPELFAVYDAVAPLVDRLGLPDTVGVATPALVGRRVRALRERYPRVDLEAHFHEDRGFSLVNALEAVRNGVRFVDTTLLGIGERSGVTSMTALLFNLFVDREYDFLEGYHLRGSYPINVLCADKLRKLVPSREPVSLTNRTHTAGVHQHAVLNDASAYEAQPLDQFGVTETETLLGPLSGWNVIHYFLKEILYYPVDESLARVITARFKERVREAGPDLSPTQLLVSLAQEEFGLQPLELPEAARGAVLQRMDEREPREAAPDRPTAIRLSARTLPTGG